LSGKRKQCEINEQVSDFFHHHFPLLFAAPIALPLTSKEGQTPSKARLGSALAPVHLSPKCEMPQME
jgi:hypothetical protein